MSLFDNLSFWWDGASTLAMHPTGQSMGTFYGTFTTTSVLDRDGIYRNKYNFTDATTYIDIGTGFVPSVKTGIVWAYFTTINSGNIMAYAGGVDIIKAASTTTIGSGMSSPTIYVNGVNGTTVDTGSWYMLAATSSTGTSGRVYINNGTGYGHVCKYGEIIYFSTVLDASQIKAIYDLTSTKYIYPHQRGERWND